MRSGWSRGASGIIVLAIFGSACASGDTSDTTGDDGGASGAYTTSSGSVSASSGTFGGSGSVSAGGNTGAPGGSGSESIGSGTGGSGAATGGDVGEAIDAGMGGDTSDETDTGPDATAPSSTADAESSAPPDTGLSVLYQVGPSAAMSAYLGCELSIRNSGTGSPALSALTIRYYFTDQVHITPEMTINWSHVSTSGADADLAVSFAFLPLVPATLGADTYIEFRFSSGHSLLAPGESAVFSWQMQGPDPSKDVYTQTDDYSFDPSKTALATWNHVVLLENGSIVWGIAP